MSSHEFSGSSTPPNMWAVVEDMFSSQSKARVAMLCHALANTKKNDMSAEIFVSKMKGYVYELGAADRKIDDNEFKEYILVDLDDDYNALLAFVSAVPSTMLTDVCA